MKQADILANNKKNANIQASANAALIADANSKTSAANGVIYLAVCVFFIILFLGFMMMRR
jgi:hypothetical protein